MTHGSDAMTVARAAVMRAMVAHDPLLALVNGIADGSAAQSIPPYVQIGDAQGSDWGTKDQPGSEVMITITAHDHDRTPQRVTQIGSSIEAALATIDHGSIAMVNANDTAPDWTIYHVRVVRTRLTAKPLRPAARAAPATTPGWSFSMDVRLRLLRR